jgi:uncharacterized membrane protein YhiD involved in acid resistance
LRYLNLPEFLISPFAGVDQLPPLEIALRLLAAMLLGGVVSLTYRWTRQSGPVDASFSVTLALLCVLIAMVTQVIGDSIARAFGLVGALSIVRFRTAVRDTEDTAYVIFAVVVGMAVGASSLWVAVIGIGAVALTEVAFTRLSGRTSAQPEYLLTLRAGIDIDLDATVSDILRDSVSRFEVRSLGTAKQGSVLEGSYCLQPRPGVSLATLLKRFDAAPGVQSVQLEVRDPGAN